MANRVSRRLFTVIALALALNAVPGPTSAQSGPLFLPGFPQLRQLHSLTCESSAASMGTRGVVTEDEIMAALPHSPNPNLGFRGNPDGQQGKALVDYGVYAAPISQALARYRFHSDVLLYSSDQELRAYLNKGWPIVVWIPYSLQPSRTRLGAYNGVQFLLVEHEHAVLAVGYDNATILANDPWNGKIVRYRWRDFNRGWGHFGNMALAISPCASTVPVDGVRVYSLSTDAVTWTWNKALNSASYDVTITRHGKKDVVIYHQVQTSRRATIALPKTGTTYEVVVRSMTACGDMTDPSSQWLTIPALPTPTPTATVTGTPSSTPVAEPSKTPTPSATPKP